MKILPITDERELLLRLRDDMAFEKIYNQYAQRRQAISSLTRIASLARGETTQPRNDVVVKVAYNYHYFNKSYIDKIIIADQ